MSFPVDLAAVLSGASVYQLHNWRRTDLLIPETQIHPALYSFRDIVALRVFVKLRKEVPLQRVRKAMNRLRDWDLAEHPSAYRLVTDGDSVFLVEDEGAVDLVRKPGQRMLLSLEDAFAPFENRQGRQVVDFRHPRPQLEVREQRLGGWPTVADTRIPYDTVAKLVVGGIAPADVARFYPAVSAQAAMDAEDFYQEVIQVGRRAA
jgi:uncharacterized protein (DUF433 family)